MKSHKEIDIDSDMLTNMSGGYFRSVNDALTCLLRTLKAAGEASVLVYFDDGNLDFWDWRLSIDGFEEDKKLLRMPRSEVRGIFLEDVNRVLEFAGLEMKLVFDKEWKSPWRLLVSEGVKEVVEIEDAAVEETRLLVSEGVKEVAEIEDAAVEETVGEAIVQTCEVGVEDVAIEIVPAIPFNANDEQNNDEDTEIGANDDEINETFIGGLGSVQVETGGVQVRRSLRVQQHTQEMTICHGTISEIEKRRVRVLKRSREEIELEVKEIARSDFFQEAGKNQFENFEDDPYFGFKEYIFQSYEEEGESAKKKPRIEPEELEVKEIARSDFFQKAGKNQFEKFEDDPYFGFKEYIIDRKLIVSQTIELHDQMPEWGHFGGGVNDGFTRRIGAEDRKWVDNTLFKLCAYFRKHFTNNRMSEQEIQAAKEHNERVEAQNVEVKAKNDPIMKELKKSIGFKLDPKLDKWTDYMSETLKPGRWMYADIIAKYSDLLYEREVAQMKENTRFCKFDPNFYQVTRGSFELEDTRDPSLIKDWPKHYIKATEVSGNFRNRKYLVFSACDYNHFLLLIFNIQKWELLILDSLDGYEKFEKEAAHFVLTTVKEFLYHRAPHLLQDKDVVCYAPKCIPRQTDGSSCGACVCMYMKAFTEDLDLSRMRPWTCEDMENFRYRMAVEIVKEGQILKD